jgi:hypothetical protein
MEQPITFGKFYGIPQGIEGVGLKEKWPKSQDGFIAGLPGTHLHLHYINLAGQQA